MAGRIPQSFIDELLDRVDIVELIDSRVKLKKSGKNYMACCPFHDEKTPSFSVNAEKQFYHCFGCGESGNAIGFLMAYEHRDFPDVVESLAREQGLEIPRENTGDSAAQRQRQELYQVLERASQYYQEQLRSHPGAAVAQEYLQRRGLTSQVAHTFRVGYAPPGWDNLLRHFAAEPAAASLLLRSGMTVEREENQPASHRAYDRFRHRIMFPIRDLRGRTIGFGGRVLNNEDKPKYLNSPETEIFHKGGELYGLYEALQANRHLDRVLIVEGYMDVVSLAQFGVTWATATLGTAASESHLEKAFRHCREVVFCFDGDEAGRRAARRALEVSLPALQDGRQVRFMFLPEGEDPDTLVRKEGAEAFQRRLSGAKPLSEFLFEVAGGGEGLGTPEARSRLVAAGVPFLRRLPDGIYKNQLRQLLAAKAQCDVREIQELLAGQTPAPAVAPSVGRDPGRVLPASTRERGPPQGLSPPPRLSLWDEATGLLLRQPRLLEQCDLTELEPLVAQGDEEGARFFRCVALLREWPDASLNKILGLWQSLHGAEESQVLYALAGREPLLDEEACRRQFQDILLRLRDRAAEARLQGLIDKARQGPLADAEKAELNRLLAQKSAVPAVSKPR